MERLFKIGVAVVVSAGFLWLMGAIAWAVLCISLQRRNVRRSLWPSMKPSFKVAWPGRVDELRDRILAHMPQSSWRFVKARLPWVSIAVVNRSGGTMVLAFV